MTTDLVHQVIPGVLEKDWQEIEKKLEVIRIFSDKVHVDIIDGQFNKNQTILDPAPFAQYKDELFLEVHLMVNEPINYLKTYYSAGFKRFIGHVEKMSDQTEFVARCELYGEVGLALDLETAIELIKVPFEDLDLIHIMSVKAGEAGQNFEESSLEKIKELREKTDVPIEVDGGINDETIKLAKDAGANYFVATSFISEAPNPKEAFEKLQTLSKD